MSGAVLAFRLWGPAVYGAGCRPFAMLLCYTAMHSTVTLKCTVFFCTVQCFVAMF